MDDINKVINKCHKNTYNYCALQDRDAMGKCTKDQATSLAVRSFLNLLTISGKANFAGAIPQTKYALQIPGYCPYLDKIATDWPTKHEKGTFALFTNYCKTKGKKC